jgi:hypothetical protein
MQLKVMSFKSIKHLLQMMHVIFLNSSKDDNIINLTLGKSKVGQNLIHNSLKFYKGII